MRFSGRIREGRSNNGVRSSQLLRGFRALGLAALFLAVAVGVAPADEPSDESPPSVNLQPPADEMSDAGHDSDADGDAGNDSEEWDDDWDEELDGVQSGFPDPFERVNRGMFFFNNAVDLVLLDPITQLYRFVLPQFARRSIVRALDNLNSPQIIVNDALQLEFRDSGVSLARLLINSTAGIGGLMDPAAGWGLPYHPSDFGQTLAIAGAPSGSYLMLPLLGPSNIRDGIGTGVDMVMHPTFYLMGGTDLLLFSGSAGLTERARHFEELQALRSSSIDYYAAMRSGFYQNRLVEVWERREHRRPPTPSAEH